MNNERMNHQLRALLTLLRARRSFDARAYVDAKVKLLNDYCTRSGLTGAVWGNSGGIDSAVVTALIAKAKKQPGSPLKRAVAARMPYFIKEGTTNQRAATARGQEVAEAFGIESVLCDLSGSHRALTGATNKAVRVKSNDWASGQLVSYLRTPALYQMATLLRQDGYPALVLGTCNRDEGAYIGYFGKAADYMTDLHLISDAHKSEVRAVATLLGVPQSVLDATPTGDIYDGRTDRELIGASYDFIELFQLLLCTDAATRSELIEALPSAARLEFNHFGKRLMQLNSENQHKYIIGSPSVHLDVYERAVPGGWRIEQLGERQDVKVDRSKLVNLVEMEPAVISSMKVTTALSQRAKLGSFGDSAFLVHKLLSKHEVAAVNAELDSKGWIPANQNGKTTTFDAEHDKVGSWRASIYSDDLAHVLWTRLAPCLPMLRFADKSGPTTDFGDYPIWRAVGVSSLMRFIKYTDGGLLVPHYDAPFDYRDGKRTLMSLVVYFTDNKVRDGGSTRFIIDPERNVPLAQRNLDDWTRLATKEDVLLRVKPKAGSALVFDHRLLHDSSALTGGVKVIMRTDVIFEKCGLPGQTNLTVSRPLGMPE